MFNNSIVHSFSTADSTIIFLSIEYKMSLTGNIGTISLSGLIQLLSNEQNTGILSVRQFDVEFQVFFLDGNIVYAIESKKIARLGELLVNDKHLTITQLNACLKDSVKRKQAIGKTLVENKLITEEILEKYLYIQVEEIIFTLFCMNQGVFKYKNTKFDMRWIVPVKLNTLRIVMDALHRLDGKSFDAWQEDISMLK